MLLMDMKNHINDKLNLSYLMIIRSFYVFLYISLLQYLDFSCDAKLITIYTSTYFLPTIKWTDSFENNYCIYHISNMYLSKHVL